MTDRDVIERAAAMFVRKPRPRKTREGRKQLWTVSITGWPAIDWMRVLLPHMGERRSDRIREILSTSYVTEVKRGQNVDACRNGHPYQEGSWYMSKRGRVCRQCVKDQRARHRARHPHYYRDYARKRREAAS